MSKIKQTVDDLHPIVIRNKIVFELRSRGVKHLDLAKKFKMTIEEIDAVFEEYNEGMLEKIAKYYDIILDKI